MFFCPHDMNRALPLHSSFESTGAQYGAISFTDRRTPWRVRHSNNLNGTQNAIWTGSRSYWSPKIPLRIPP
eukprot:scaffold109030_cov32-Attheya_sp.AAC.2